ncbi:MAG TPA: hypothetical protein VJA26_17785, partial [Gammaproteobacteria bacterium]|nr:hypothetical protein [Gammaproteobacteria bacterium]
FDQGGMAGLILVMRNADVDAFASLDSGILYPHPSGLPGASPNYDPFALRIPWLHATSPRGATPPSDSDVKSLFETAVHSNRYLLVTDGMGHVDFTSYALIEGRRAMPNYWGDWAPERAVRHGIVAEYINNFFAAFLRHDAESLVFLSHDPNGAFPGSNMTLEQRAATPSSIGYDELVQAIVAGRAEQAINELRAVAGVEPNHIFLDEAHLQRLAVSLLYTWGFAKEAMPLIEFTAERYPSSAQAQAMMAEGYVLIENYPAAIEVLSKYVQQHPNDAGAQARLEQVRNLESQKGQ